MSMTRRFRCLECEQVGGLDRCESLAHLGELLAEARDRAELADRFAIGTGARHWPDEEPDDNDPYALDGYGG